VTLKPAAIRGVVSEGMVCSPRELGLSDEHEGILVLPADAPLGAKLADYLGDVVLDLEVTPNRPDMLSMLGVAHETAALAGGSVREPLADYIEAGEDIKEKVAVEIRDAELCPRYCAALLTGVKIGPSPGWLKARLEAGGVRSINNVVDITNFVMLEYGQPLHAFDYDKIRHGRIVVRRAYDREMLVTLDGVEHKLAPETLVIADPERALAVAGVMGGANSEITDATINILLESASFKPAGIHHTAAELKMGSEASRRFERGISPELTLRAARRAAGLMVEICAATAARGIVDVYPGRVAAPAIALTAAEFRRILGMDIELERIKTVLGSLGCALEEGRPGELLVSAPYWRSDIRIAADVIEEVARVLGYENIPYTRLGHEIPPFLPSPLYALKNRIKSILSGYGAVEIMGYSITSRDVLQKGLNAELLAEPLKLLNPMAADQECLRTSLRGSTLAALAFNLKRNQGNIFIFELGHVYLARAGDLPEEPEMLCGVLTSAGQEKVWRARREPLEIYDAKGVMEGLMHQLGAAVSFEAGSDPGLRAGHQAALTAGGEALGVLGEIHPQVASAFELSTPVFLFELNVSALLSVAGSLGSYSVLPRFPAVERDLALIVDEGVTHSRITDIIRQFALVKKVTLFDVYTGKQVAGGRKSLAYSLTFQAADHTLKDAEVDGVMAAVLKRLLAELGAEQRGAYSR
jgi:phenylalanyl-tRNA synthetase beta chain